jgi:hypothetical protein
MSEYQAIEIDATGMYRIIDPTGAQMPVRPLGRKGADSIIAVLNLFLDPER